MNVLNYKGFSGVFNYIEDEEVFFGKVDGIKDLVTFEAKKISEIQSVFIDAVEDYLELTKEVEIK